MKTEFHKLKLEHLNNCLKHWLLRERINQDENQCSFFLFIHSNSFILCSHFPRNFVLYHKTMANCLCVCIYWAFDEISKSRFQNYIPSNCTNLLLFISNEHDKVALIQRVAFMYTQNYAYYTTQLTTAQNQNLLFLR